MKAFAALRFTEDINLCGRVYWYVAPFPVKAGDRVLAPVGPHDRLQCARVEFLAPEGEEPYPAALSKEIASMLGDRERAGYIDLGGIRYDDRHYTRLGRVFLSEKEVPFDGESVAAEREDAILRAAFSPLPVLLYGEGVHGKGVLLLAIVRGRETEDVPPSVLAAVREKLC